MIYTLYQYLSVKIKNYLKKDEYIPNSIDTNNVKININVN